ncbi:ROK family transcriptional regulator [Streptomyces sp. ST2-7A]|uniref:ROK family transcriptional regulator n=1 Tax=Streptomyces sp. ST2-7A TaxID=2907214 RepID=UPI001F490E4D|nr:ROK family transcriptional regulator [Streptomyces sp. ST2-7A]MCE7082022.1 ROK family transcriptional regulator [Streptomyces sp. ST2-7A]
MRTDRVTPGSQTSLREANRARIVEAVQRRGALTQIELAGVTGLSPATVSNIVKELAAAGVLHTSPSTRSGRRALQVSLARNLGLVAGVHFGNRSLRVALADASLRVLADQRMPLAPDHRADVGLRRAALLVTEMVESVDAGPEELLAMGVCLPAPVDRRTGGITTVGMMRGWDGVPLPELLGEELDVPVVVDNDANLGALAETRFGAAVGHDPVVYLRVSHGVGGGLVLGGQLVHGRAGGAGEIGHVTIDERGPICRCGNRGCLETFVGAPALLGMLAGSHGNLTLGDLIGRAAEGDPGCRRVLADTGRHLGVAAANICNLIDPGIIVVGGRLAEAGDLLLDPMRAVIEQRTMPSPAGPPGVAAAALGAAAEVRGALAVALDTAGVGAGVGGALGVGP